MTTDRTFTIRFKDGTTLTGLSFDESDKLWEEARDTDNPARACYQDNVNYETP